MIEDSALLTAGVIIHLLNEAGLCSFPMQLVRSDLTCMTVHALLHLLSCEMQPSYSAMGRHLPAYAHPHLVG